ncbi:XRE family transcriptional regulator [Paenibacillus sp. FSL H8-0537]|uniref:XRE family transcriptional regulator n=1 Tax=Paenibacillus sp. FSL H8-0537 TaxID=2921399 RepID=UPI0031017225
MKFELGRCLLNERLIEAGMNIDELAQLLFYKPERITDFIDKKRIMPLKIAISIADTIGCNVNALYELISIELS